MIWCTLGLGYPAWNMAASMFIIVRFFIRPRGRKIRKVTSWVNHHLLYMMTINTLSISYNPELWLVIWTQVGTEIFKWWQKSRCSTLSTMARMDPHLKIKGNQGELQQLLSTIRMIVCWEARIQLRARTLITGHSLATQEAQAMVGISSLYLRLSLVFLKCIYPHR